MINEKPIKMKILSDTKKNRKRMTAASGSYSSLEKRNYGSDSSLDNKKYAGASTVNVPITKNAQYAGSGANAVWSQPMFFSPMHTPQNWQIASKRREIYQWARFYYFNEPKVAAGVDFYANFSQNGFTIECKKKKILKYYEKLIDRMSLAERLNEISHEYFLLGDVFPFLEISCPVCHGKGLNEDGELCNHPDGTFKSIKVMNPDYIDVKKNPIANDSKFYLLPDDELKTLVQRKDPIELYEKLPQTLIDLISAGQPIALSDRCASHIKHNASPYGTYGTSMLQRLFTQLAYKTKIMTANWIIAERLILPIRVVKVGDKDRPATEEDLQDVVNQLASVASDPNLTIVTHHAFEYEWYGACFPDNDSIEILTQEGWKTHNNIQEGEKIATYNVNNKKMEFQNYIEKFEYEYDSGIYGGLYKYGEKCMDIQVTPNHRMYSRRSLKHNYETIMSQDIKTHYKFLSQVDWDGEIPQSFPLNSSPLSHLSIEDFLKFAGYYLSEGHVKKEYHKNLSQECQTQAMGITQRVDSDCYSDIEDLVRKVYKKASIHKDDRGSVSIHTFMINSVDIARYMEKEFSKGSANKKISRWILDLPKKYLQIILESLMNGDGSVLENKNYSKFKYTTASKELSDNVSEILLKLGFSPTVSFCKGDISKQRGDVYNVYWSDFKSLNERQVQKIERIPYKGKVWCYSVPNEFLIVRCHGRAFIIGNSGKIHNITSEMELIGKEILDGLMLNQAILNGEMAGYSSAQVGIEVLIRRLENWRNKLKEWVEKHIFLPVAMMQGFIDEEESRYLGEVVYLYPKFVWNDLQLRDNTNKIQTMMQLYDKGIVSAQTILEELGLDYDTEIEKIRDEQVMASASGMLPPGGGMGGAPGGMPLDMGGMGGAPPIGGDMGGMGEPPMGGDMGGMGGAPPMGGDMGAAASSLPKITKKGKGSSQDEEQSPTPKLIKFTKLEQKMYKILQGIGAPQSLFAQYSVKPPGESRPFVLDFAYPQIGVGVETDGNIWHQRADFKQRDMIRDQKLANIGWRILRFRDDAVEENSDSVKEVIMQNIADAIKTKKKANETGLMKKEASKNENFDSVYEYMLNQDINNIGINLMEIPGGLGQLVLIGTIE